MNSGLSITIAGATGWLGLELINILNNLNISDLKLELIASNERKIEINRKKFSTSIFTKSNLSEADIYFDFAFLTREKIKTLGPEKYIAVNKNIISNSVRLIKLKQPKSVILASSGAVYRLGNNDLKENNHIYSDLKLMQEEKIGEACSGNGINLIITRIFSLSGNGISKIDTFAIAEMVSRAFRNQKLHIKSNYLVHRRYCDITQLLNLLLDLNRNSFTGVIDSGGIKIELRELAQTIIEELGSNSEIDFPIIDKNSTPDEYYSKSNLFEDLLLKYSNKKPLSIKEQIKITKNSLFPLG
jgi:nucleoside-diphosphate-sugar epimerase